MDQAAPRNLTKPARCLTNWKRVPLKKLSVPTKVPVPVPAPVLGGHVCLRGQFGASVSVYFPFCSGHLNRLTRRLAPKGRRKREEPALPQNCWNWLRTLAVAFPELGEGTRASFRAGRFCSRSQGGDNLTQGVGAEQIQFSHSIREVMLCGVHTQHPTRPSPVNQSIGWGPFCHFKTVHRQPHYSMIGGS